MRTVFLVRHGDYNYLENCPETLGQGLSDLGKQQAETTADWFYSLPDKLTSIYSSDYLRAKETAEIIASRFPTLSVIVQQELRECSDIYYKELNKPFIQADIAFQNIFLSSAPSNQYQLIVCHANLIRYFLSRILAWSRDQWEGVYIANCSISEIKIAKNNNFKAISIAMNKHFPEHLQDIF